MAARTSLLSKRRPHTRAILTDPSGVLRRASTVAWLRLVVTAASRRTRAHLGMLGVPLAITASLMAGVWWTVLPLALCAWWWTPRYTGWEWVGAVGRGLVGAEWAFIGCNAIVTFPHHLLIVGALWSLGAGLLGLCGSEAVRQRSRHVPRDTRQGAAVQMRRNPVPSVRRRFAMHLASQRAQGAAGKRH
jgi:hypothetical protein